MKLSISDVIHLLEFVTNDQIDVLLHQQQYLLNHALIDNNFFDQLNNQKLETLKAKAGNKGTITADATVDSTDFEEELSAICKDIREHFSTWVENFISKLPNETQRDIGDKATNVLNDSLKEYKADNHQTYETWQTNVKQWNTPGCRLSDKDKQKKHDDLLEKTQSLLVFHLINFNGNFTARIKPILTTVDAKTVKYPAPQLPKHTTTLDLIEKLAQGERDNARTGLNKVVTSLGKGLANLPELIAYCVGKGLDKAEEYLWFDENIHSCQDLMTAYQIYEKTKPIFGTDDDKKILGILHNKGFSLEESEHNKFLIAQANIILSDTPPNEFIKLLNVKLLGLEQRIWQLAVQPAINWDSQHRQALQHLMGLLLYIEQTNRELSINTLNASDNYQTKDAWWKIFAVVGALAPPLLIKFGALNYLAHWFGSSSSISALLGKSIMKAIGSVGNNGDYKDVKENQITISTNSDNNNEVLTSTLITSGLAVETLSMVVATRISYLNYASATDAYKKMIEEAEHTATHVVDRCSRLLCDRLNYVERALPFYDTSKIETLRQQIYAPPLSLHDQRIGEIKSLLKKHSIEEKGEVQKGEETKDDKDKDVTLYQYKGIVFRSDSRKIQDVNTAGGLKSQQSLSSTSNMLEAQGLTTKKGLGATGQCGASCARYIDGAYFYGEFVEGRNRMYIIDTNTLNSNHYAYDMSAIVTNNYPNTQDETGFEVNCTEIPMKAILGFVEYSTDLNYLAPTFTPNRYLGNTV